MNLPQLLDLMHAKRVLRVKTVLWVEDRAAPTEVELAPDAFAWVGPAKPEAITAQPDRCACSHSIIEEHNESGCLQGCSYETCAPMGGGEEEA